MPQRTIREVLALQKPNVASLDMTVRDAVRLMVKENCGSIMVERDGKLVGIFTERDALIRVLADGRNSDTTHLHEVMTRNPVFVHPDKSLMDALHMMRQYGFRHVPVVEDGRPVGVISVSDALATELSQFESELKQLEGASYGALSRE